MAAISYPSTIADIVDRGLELGGDTGLDSEATVYLVLLLEKLARDYDWAELLTSTAITVTAEQSTVDISALTDYKAVRKVMLDNVADPLTEASGGYPDLIHSVNEAARTSNYGTPAEYATTPDKQDLVLYPIPAQAYTGTLLYYRIPAAPTADTESPWFPDTMALVAAVAEYSKLHSQESLVTLVERQVKTMIASARAAARDRGRDRPVTMRRDRSSFPEVRIDRG